MDISQIRQQAESPVVATAADLASVAADLDSAFSNDVMFDWFLRPDGRRTEARARFFRLIVQMGVKGQALIERPAGGGAAAIWLPFEHVNPMSMMDEIRSVPTMLHATGLGRISRLMALRADLDTHHPMERRHAYLWFLGVAQEAQGHGVGSALLRVANARLDAAGQPAYLETQTERNVGLYRRHGFDVISEHKPRPDAPTMWSMWREAGADAR